MVRRLCPFESHVNFHSGLGVQSSMVKRLSNRLQCYRISHLRRGRNLAVVVPMNLRLAVIVSAPWLLVAGERPLKRGRSSGSLR